ncbi:hypothetical protein QFZ31_001436 [Neobacillus niacini]|uniref:hypothetical protein n=1 Tax=Neobacillus driksii TaxID=3035913 RepID=UPI002785DAEF|nr:hypothetical protein [Neobacillus niacini]MDQ0971558.1 hypothetical protein [Neobacillus niacini]
MEKFRVQRFIFRRFVDLSTITSTPELKQYYEQNFLLFYNDAKKYENPKQFQRFNR